MFYFDKDYFLIYPDELGGYDQIMARVCIPTSIKQQGDTYNFYEEFHIDSLKENCAVVFKTISFSKLMDSLKACQGSGQDAEFKIAVEQQANGIKRQILEIVCKDASSLSTLRFVVPIKV